MKDEKETTYKIEYEFPKKPETVKEEIITENSLGDIFDVYGMASNVHSKKSGMTRDYTLAKYDTEIINTKFPKFIREQRKIVRILKSFMIIPREMLEKVYNKETATYINMIMKKNYEEIEGLLIGEIDEMVIISRAGRGEVIKAMLMHGKNREEQEEYEQEVEGKKTIDKLKEKK